MKNKIKESLDVKIPKALDKNFYSFTSSLKETEKEKSPFHGKVLFKTMMAFSFVLVIFVAQFSRTSSTSSIAPTELAEIRMDISEMVTNATIEEFDYAIAQIDTL